MRTGATGRMHGKSGRVRRIQNGGVESRRDGVSHKELLYTGRSRSLAPLGMTTGSLGMKTTGLPAVALLT